MGGGDDELMRTNADEGGDEQMRTNADEGGDDEQMRTNADEGGDDEQMRTNADDGGDERMRTNADEGGDEHMRCRTWPFLGRAVRSSPARGHHDDQNGTPMPCRRTRCPRVVPPLKGRATWSLGESKASPAEAFVCAEILSAQDKTEGGPVSIQPISGTQVPNAPISGTNARFLDG